MYIETTPLYGLICCIVLSQIPNTSKAGEVSYSLHFNNFKYDKVAVDDALVSFFGNATEKHSDHTSSGFNEFATSVQQNYSLAVEVLDVSAIHRTSISFKGDLKNNVAIKVSLTHGYGSGAYQFPDGLGVFTDPAVMRAHFRENILEMAFEKHIPFSKNKFLFLKTGMNFGNVNIRSHINSVLLNVRSFENHKIFYPEYTVGFNFENSLSISPSISFENINDPMNHFSVSFQVSKKF